MMKRKSKIFQLTLLTIETIGLVSCGQLKETDQYLSFGTYPTSLVTDENKVNELNANIDLTDVESNWTAKDTSVDHDRFIYYKDVDLDSDGVFDYRGLYYSSSNVTNYFNGDWMGKRKFEFGKVYWYKYEPIKWKIAAEYSNTYLLIADQIIDTISYYQSDYKDSITYKSSSVREYLNGVFYYNVFSKKEKEAISPKDVSMKAEAVGTNFGNTLSPTEYVLIPTKKMATKAIPNEYALGCQAFYRDNFGAYWIEEQFYYKDVAGDYHIVCYSDGATDIYADTHASTIGIRPIVYVYKDKVK